jgi:pyruvate dehydrogenase complex dehydrogenase (E1) component
MPIFKQFQAEIGAQYPPIVAECLDPLQHAPRTAQAIAGTNDQISPESLAMLRELERKVLWLASWTIHQRQPRARERRRPQGRRPSGLVGLARDHHDGALLRRAAAAGPRRGEAACQPIFHAIQYLLGNQTREKLENFRGYKGAQSYPSRTKDADDVDFSTGSVGLGVAQTLFSSLVQDYVRAHGWAAGRPEGRMIALVGDAETRRGQHLRGAARRLEAGRAQLLVDHRLQPPEPRRGGARRPVGALRATVPRISAGTW